MEPKKSFPTIISDAQIRMTLAEVSAHWEQSKQKLESLLPNMPLTSDATKFVERLVECIDSVELLLDLNQKAIDSGLRLDVGHARTIGEALETRLSPNMVDAARQILKDQRFTR